MRIFTHMLCLLLLFFSTISAESVYSLTHRKSTDTRSSSCVFKKLGNHIIAEFTGCTNLNNRQGLEKVLREAAQAANATVLSVTTHQFEPAGVTGVAVLQESHISVHTWPEYGYVAIDIFTCGQHVIVDNALEILKNFFAPHDVSRIYVDRGFE